MFNGVAPLGGKHQVKTNVNFQNAFTVLRVQEFKNLVNKMLISIFRFTSKKWIPIKIVKHNPFPKPKTIIGLELTKYLKNYASIGEKYTAILEDIIEKNSLTDFDNANLLPTKSKKGLATLCIGGGMGVAMCIERS